MKLFIVNKKELYTFYLALAFIRTESIKLLKKVEKAPQLLLQKKRAIHQSGWTVMEFILNCVQLQLGKQVLKIQLV